MPTNFSIEILNPEDPQGAKIHAEIPHRLILRYYKFSPVRYENLRAAKFVLENPLRIFAGVRVFNEGGWCFAGRPHSWYVTETEQRPFPSRSCLRRLHQSSKSHIRSTCRNCLPRRPQFSYRLGKPLYKPDMEAHFLSDVVAGETRGFTPEPWYNSFGDCIIYQMEDEAIVAERIDAVLTIYRSALTQKPIGYQIKGVAALMQKYGWGGVFVESKEDGDGLKEVSISALLLAAYEEGPKTTSRRRGYADALETFQPGNRLRVDAREVALN